MTGCGRRIFLGRLAGIAGGAALPAALAAAPQQAGRSDDRPQERAWPELLCAWNRGGANHAGLWTVGQGVSGVPLPFRAHAVLADPLDHELCIAIARRPGDSMARVSLHGNREVVLVDVEPARVLNGHAALSNDGRTLYTTEGDAADGTGWVSARDSTTLDTVALFATRGIDPHAVLVEPDGSLLVANGGVPMPGFTACSKPVSGCLDPSLVRIDPRNGQCIGQWRLPDPRLSIRHLARGANGRVGIALQAEHAVREARDDACPFAWFDGAALHLADKAARANLRGYGGDVACVEAWGATRFAVSCTRAGVVAWWDDEGRWLGVVPLDSACALVDCGEALIAAGQDGSLLRIGAAGLQARVGPTSPGVDWDNHMAIRQPREVPERVRARSSTGITRVS